MVSFPRMFGAIVMPVKVAFPRRFIEAFTAITCGPAGAESDERRVDTACCRGIGSHRTLSSSGAANRRGIHYLYRRRSCIARVSDVGVSRRSHDEGNRIHWVCQRRSQLNKY